MSQKRALGKRFAIFVPLHTKLNKIIRNNTVEVLCVVFLH